MATPDQLDAYSQELYEALRARRTLVPLSTRDPELTIDDAYKISLGFLERRLADGEKVIGKKIGVTSKPVQDMLNVRQPDFGFLTDVMEIPDGGTAVIADGLIQPRAEAEIGFVLKSDLKGPGVSMQNVLDATDYIMPCFEIVDSRIADWKIKIADTVADNASCGVFVLGKARANPRDFDLAALKVTVMKNGQFLSEGLGAAVQGSPLAAIAWLANTLGPYGVTLNAGDIILSGSLVPLEPARPGDIFSMELSGVGATSITFA
ncbi:MAG TPA: fumarylacetoacetate hydrolase family protein [Alphaproteobacteria bacterium]|nr:fumarylacetoacetate hydrolase family protein [Alphaproteobacteria bacterium]